MFNRIHPSDSLKGHKEAATPGVLTPTLPCPGPCESPLYLTLLILASSFLILPLGWVFHVTLWQVLLPGS